MMAARRGAKLKSITEEVVKIKVQQMKKALSHDAKKIEELVAMKFRERIEKGKLGGMNLSFEKARLLSEIGLIEQRLSIEKNS